MHAGILPPGTGQAPPWTRHPPGPGTPPGTRSRACWEIRSTSGRYASYCNAFLFYAVFDKKSWRPTYGVGVAPVWEILDPPLNFNAVFIRDVIKHNFLKRWRELMPLPYSNCFHCIYLTYCLMCFSEAGRSWFSCRHILVQWKWWKWGTKNSNLANNHYQLIWVVTSTDRRPFNWTVTLNSIHKKTQQSFRQRKLFANAQKKHNNP